MASKMAMSIYSPGSIIKPYSYPNDDKFTIIISGSIKYEQSTSQVYAARDSLLLPYNQKSSSILRRTKVKILPNNNKEMNESVRSSKATGILKPGKTDFKSMLYFFKYNALQLLKR